MQSYYRYKPGDSQQQSQPAPSGRIRVSFKFGLPPAMSLEQKVMRAEKLEQDLRAAFPGYTVRIKEQFGRVSRTGEFAGDATQKQAAGGGNTDVASFDMEGAPL